MIFLDDPWGTAEDVVFKILCEGTGYAEKRQAFLGFLPPVKNVFALKIGGGGDVSNTWTAPITELRMDADIEGIFEDRKIARLMAWKILNCLPIRRIANIQTFSLRNGGQADIKSKGMVLANETEERLVWTLTIGCSIVFNTVEKPQ